MADARRIAVIGGGWAGVAAAVEATARGDAVTLFEMAPQLGGRARSFEIDGVELDNGQHIAIGAYSATLALLRRVGVDPATAFLRTPLRLVDPEGCGLRLRSGPPALAFAAAVLAHAGWGWRDRAGLLRAACGWVLQRFRCVPGLTVSALAARTTRRVREELIEPLCIAALNTPAHAASAGVFLRVLRDALFSGPGSSDLLLPRLPLSRLLPAPATEWLRAAGAQVNLACRVGRLEPVDARWRVDGAGFDAVVLATSALEAARLTAGLAPDWSRRAAALRYEPIVTVYLHSRGTRLSEPMLCLRAGPEAPAQFVFDRGQLGGPPGLLAFVVSGAQAWVDRGREATLASVEQQARESLSAQLVGELTACKVLTEHRATFACTPGLQRPGPVIALGLLAAADYVQGPYPATLEGAVRSGVAAAHLAHETATTDA